MSKKYDLQASEGKVNGGFEFKDPDSDSVSGLKLKTNKDGEGEGHTGGTTT